MHACVFMLADSHHFSDLGILCWCQNTNLELFCGPTSRSFSFHEVYDARSQLTRIRSMHWLALRRINALDSLIRCVLGIPIHSSRDVL
jgi:hypothetical protein